MSSLSPQSPEATNMVPRPSDVFAEPPAFVPDDSEPLDLISFMALEEADVPVDGGTQTEVPGVEGTRTEGETADPTDKALKLERFSGAPKTIGLVEWRRRFVALSAARRWSWPMVVAKLKAFLTGPAARLIDVYQLPQDPKAAVEAIWAALDKAYGLTVPQALARLRSCTYDPAVPGPSVDELAANIIEWCTVAWAFLDPVHRDSVAASLFWASLPKTSQTKHIYGQLTAGKAPGSLTLVASVEAARPLFEEERDEVTELSMVGTSSTGPDRSRGHAPPFSRSSSRSSHPYGAGHPRGRRHGSGKGHGRAGAPTELNQLATMLKSLMRSQLPSSRSSSTQADRKCFACGDKGHLAKACPRVQRSQVGGMVVLRCVGDSLLFLLDTGCSLTLVTRSAVSRLGAASTCSRGSRPLYGNASVIHGIAGVATGTACVGEFHMGLGGVTLNRVLLLDRDLPTIGGLRIDGLLGMDFVRACGSLTLSFPPDGFPVLRVPSFVHLPSLSPPSYTPLVGCTAKTPVLSRDYGVQVTDGIDCPVSRLHELGSLRNGDGGQFVVSDLVETGDFVLRQLTSTDRSSSVSSYWEVEWKWLSGIPSRHLMPPDYGTSKFDQRLIGLWQAAIDEWIAEGWLVPTPLCDLRATSPLLLIPQEHKPSTPVRPVIDLKWLNDRISSYPNELRAGPVECPSHIRRWRAFEAPLEELRLLDLRKAFLQIRLSPCQTFFVGLRLRWKSPEGYRMVRLPFGLAISPKVLEVALDRTLSPYQGLLDKYLDDIILPASLVDQVRASLLASGFPTKPPEVLLEARVLGLQCSRDGRWRRRGPVPRLEVFTRRGVHAWAGRFVSHYPLVGWARPAFSALKRLACVRHDGSKSLWDEPLEPHVLEACHALQRDIDARGDPVGGYWRYDRTRPWRLFTDSSKFAYGTVLCIGDIVVEDSTHLRRVGDTRHINLAELDALVKGLTLVDRYIRALRWTDRLSLTICCDNRSAVSWVTRHLEKHWRSVSGLHATLVEHRLRTLRDLVTQLRLDVCVEYVASDANIADPLSRIPLYCAPRPDAFGVTASLAVPALASPARDAEGRLIITTTAELDPLASELHDHEGSQSLFGRLRELVSFPDLREYCRNFVRNCPDCGLGKVTVSAAVEAGIRPTTITPRASEPWQSVHTDVVGPYKDSQLYVVTLIDNYSGYLLTRVTRSMPTGQVAASLLRDVLERFNTLPRTVHHDGGSQFTSVEYLTALTWAGCRGCRSPVNSSWTNGKVERVHRVLNDRIRSSVASGLTFVAFKHLVSRATLRYNTAPVRRYGLNPHQLIFTFPAWPYPGVDGSYRPEVPAEVSAASSSVTTPGVARRPRVPKVGEIWLCRRFGHLKKYTRPFEPCLITAQLSDKVFLTRTVTGRKSRPTHLHHLKYISPTAASRLDLGSLLSPGEGGV